MVKPPNERFRNRFRDGQAPPLLCNTGTTVSENLICSFPGAPMACIGFVHNPHPENRPYQALVNGRRRFFRICGADRRFYFTNTAKAGPDFMTFFANLHKNRNFL